MAAPTTGPNTMVNMQPPTRTATKKGSKVSGKPKDKNMPIPAQVIMAGKEIEGKVMSEEEIISSIDQIDSMIEEARLAIKEQDVQIRLEARTKSIADRVILNSIKEDFDGSKVTIHYPGHKFHGKTAHVFHRFSDGRVNAQIRGFRKWDLTNLTLKPGEFKDHVKEDFIFEAGKKTKSAKSEMKRKYLGKSRGRTATGKPAHTIDCDPTISSDKDSSMKRNKMPAPDRGI